MQPLQQSPSTCQDCSLPPPFPATCQIIQATAMGAMSLAWASVPYVVPATRSFSILCYGVSATCVVFAAALLCTKVTCNKPSSVPDLV